MRRWIVLASLMFMICGASPLDSGKYAESRALFRETMSKGAALVSFMESRDLEIVKIDMDLIGVALNKQTLKVLSTNFTYLITATGQPSRIADLDIEVYYLNGENTSLVARDEEIDNNPAVTFRPYVNGTYVINLKVAKMLPGYEQAMGYYFLAIAHD